MTDLQIFDALAPHIEDALRASIRRFGVLSPVTRDQHGRIIDGHHRVRIAEEEGIGIADDVIIHVADDDEAREIARTLNADRRQLTEEQRREVSIELRKGGHSIRAIAGALGVPPATTQRDTAGVSPDTPDGRTRGVDGKSYPARRPQPAAPEPEPVSDADLLAGHDWQATPEPAPVAPEPAPEPARLPSGQDRADDIVTRIDRAVNTSPTPAAESDDPHAEGDARREAELAAAMENTVQRFRANFARARKQAGEITTFDVDRTAEVFSGNWDREVGDLLWRLRTWCDQVEAAHRRRKAAGLHVINGGVR